MIKQRLSRFGVRLPIALAAGAAAIVTVAVLATSGSAQAPPTSLHFVGTAQKRVGFFPKHEPRAGDRFGFGDKVTGDDTGVDRGVCTVIATHDSFVLCTIEVKLSKGTLSAQALLPKQRSNNTPAAITGGTGAYDGARGTALVTNVSHKKTDITVTLLP